MAELIDTAISRAVKGKHTDVVMTVAKAFNTLDQNMISKRIIKFSMHWLLIEVYSELCKTCNTDRFAKLVKGF